MFRQPVTRLILLLMVHYFCSPVAGRQQPAPKPAPQMEEEPVISPYINETGQKKDMKIEEYLQGWSPPKWTPNGRLTLAAQAILARTFTMENIQEGRVRQLRNRRIHQRGRSFGL